jgi:hypothetical protein
VLAEATGDLLGHRDRSGFAPTIIIVFIDDLKDPTINKAEILKLVPDHLNKYPVYLSYLSSTSTLVRSGKLSEVTYEGYPAGDLMRHVR